MGWTNKGVAPGRESDASYIDVTEFGVKGDDTTDNSNALAVARTSALITGRGLFFPTGVYRGTLKLWQGARIKGGGWGSVLRRVSTTSTFVLTHGTAAEGSSDPTGNLSDVLVSDVSIEGAEATPTFDEQRHLVFLSAISDIRFERVRFKSFAGDAVYLGSGQPGVASERHNQRITIRDCFFDGVNRENRNAISVVDGSGVTVENCVFVNVSKSTMPGPIDFEPNSNAYHIISDIRVVGNRFYGCGGSVGIVAFVVPAAVTSVAKNIEISGNLSLTYQGTGSFLYVDMFRAPTSSSDSSNIVFRDNVTIGGVRPFTLAGVKGVRFAGNRFTDFTSGAYLGFTDTSDALWDIEFHGNTYTRVASGANNIVFRIYTVSHLRFWGEVFDDCCNGAAGSTVFDFNTGTSDYVSMRGNKITTSTGKTLAAVVTEVTHTYTPENNDSLDNQYGTLGSTFSAAASDSIPVTYTPVIVGGTSAGSGTYTTQYGSYVRRGKLIQFTCLVTANAGHAGTGQIRVSLPVSASAAYNYARMMPVLCSGVSSTGGNVGSLNTGTTVDGIVGAMGVFSSATGTATNVNIPAGSFTIYVQGEYLAA